MSDERTHDQQIIDRLEKRIAALGEQLSEAVRLRDKFDGALTIAGNAARRRGERINALEKEHEALLLDRNELLAHYQRATAEVLTLREDKARLDRLEHELLYNPAWPLIGCLLDGALGILDMDAGSEFGDETATDPTLRGALDKAFARLDAARKGAPDVKAKGN